MSDGFTGLIVAFRILRTQLNTMQIAVYGRTFKQENAPLIQHLFNVLHEEGINAFVYAPFLKELHAAEIDFKRDVADFDSHLDFVIQNINFVITLGGDGTILYAVTKIREAGIPILGINLGRLGFLASVERQKVKQAIHMLKMGRFNIDSRTLLKLDCNLPLFGDLSFALNDCTILKRDTSSMITIHTYINGAYLNSYWSDGLIVATPTGSTGYSLSCGGPIIFPNSGNFVITPVAPHNLNVRPIVISDDAVISFQIEGRSENFLCTLDARFKSITSEHELAVRRCNFKANLVRLEGGFLETIRAKLDWGLDRRN
ncbi:MAG: NAD kinase [Bacteroidota bacterium]